MKTERTQLLLDLCKDPKRLELLSNILDNPKKGLDALALMISRSNSAAEIMRLQDLRNSLELYLAEEKQNGRD